MTRDMKAKPHVLVSHTSVVLPSKAASAPEDLVPPIITREGEDATRCFLEFFNANIENRNTRLAYARAVGQFLSWCEANGITLHEIQPMMVAAYREQHPGSAQTINQHLAAIRKLFDWLVTRHVLPMNPAASVKGSNYSFKKGKTPVLSTEDARRLLNSIDTSHVVGLRDRALIGLMVYSFARVSAVVGMQVSDYYQNEQRWWVRLHEEGEKFHSVPVHHTAQEYLDTYIDAAGIAEDKTGPLFRTTIGRSKRLTKNQVHRTEALLMVKRRAKEAGFSSDICCHTFRATGITAYLQNGGTLENAQMIAAHESPRTTKLYNRTSDAISRQEIERIRI